MTPTATGRCAASAGGICFPVTDDLLTRLSPIQFDHINFLGRYAFTRSSAPGTRPLRDPHTRDDEDPDLD